MKKCNPNTTILSLIFLPFYNALLSTSTRTVLEWNHSMPAEAGSTYNKLNRAISKWLQEETDWFSYIWPPNQFKHEAIILLQSIGNDHCGHNIKLRSNHHLQTKDRGYTKIKTLSIKLRTQCLPLIQVFRWWAQEHWWEGNS